MDGSQPQSQQLAATEEVVQISRREAAAGVAAAAGLNRLFNILIPGVAYVNPPLTGK